MKRLICTALALGAMTAAAAAEPAKLSDDQMAKVAAGALVSIGPVAVITQVSPAVAVAVGVLGGRASATATSFNIGSIKQVVHGF